MGRYLTTLLLGVSLGAGIRGVLAPRIWAAVAPQSATAQYLACPREFQGVQP